ncbi:MAG: 16S rRNA (uracil(1498)-N(3))-methyltransferase, partial [Thiovulaceae bacterium]|nr:16S rRNA (uracil(1498)-N(3))-methyltransferase [Sulfurimonadaceae bacterium]
ERSQRNIKLDFKRFERILHASMQQCGSTQKIEFDTSSSLEEFIKQNPEAKVFDFVEKTLDEVKNISTVIIGCEGGFSENEREFLKALEVFRLDTPMVLRSESAVMAVASKLLL